MKVCCFGEILMRMTPDIQGRWLENNYMPVYVGGSELNVANALAIWNSAVKYVSVMPDNNVTREIKQYLERRGIDLNSLLFTGDRLGIYYLTPGADLKHTSVTYDRAYSSFSNLQPGQLNWNEILKDVDWLHFSAITPAISKQLAEVCLELVQIAAARSIKISVDLNYRSRLWQYGQAPAEIMIPLAKHCDVIMGNIWSAETLLEVNVTSRLSPQPVYEEYIATATACAQELQEKFPKCAAVANTFRFDHNEGIQYYATLSKAGSNYVSSMFTAEKIIGKVGSGDCFMAGLIYGFRKKLPDQEVINFAAAAAYLKLMEEGDLTDNNVAAINSTINNGQ